MPMANWHDVISDTWHQRHVKRQQDSTDSIAGAFCYVDNDTTTFWLFNTHTNIK